MKLEDQVCSLELAKKLKKLGVEQESEFWWKDGCGLQLRSNTYKYDFDTSDCFDKYSAFTVAELGEMLPDVVQHSGREPWLSVSKIGGEWFYKYQVGAAEPEFRETDYNEADARAKILIYLLENNLLQVDN